MHEGKRCLFQWLESLDEVAGFSSSGKIYGFKVVVLDIYMKRKCWIIVRGFGF